MTVWLVNPFDNLPCEGTRPQRYWLMAEAYVRAGHRVVYWTSDFSHATKSRRIQCSANASAEGIEVVQIPTIGYHANVCLARVRSHRRLAADFRKLARARLKQGDSPSLVIASAPPLGLCESAMRIAREAGAKFVCDIQDAWPETFERILPRFVWSLLGLSGAARRIYRGADAVSAVARRYLDLAREYGSTAPQHLAGHSIDACLASRDSGGDHAHLDGCMRLVYVGNMSMSYDLATVIRAVAAMPEVTLDLAGNGPDRAHLERLAEDAKGRVRFHGYLGASDLEKLLMECDVGIVPMFPESCVGVPGKLADYAAAGLRVIESLGGECREILERCGVGVHYDAGNADSISTAIARLKVEKREPASGNFQEFFYLFDARRIMAEYVRWSTEL